MSNANMLQEHIQTQYGLTVDLDAPWQDTGLTSMQLIYVAFFIDETYGVFVTDEMMADIHTVRDFLALVPDNEAN